MSSLHPSIVIFQGSKFFWRNRKTIDITTAEHRNIDITEIISYDPSFDIEAPRIYLNSTILYSCLDQDSIDTQLSFAKKNNVPHSASFLRNTFNAAIVNYILNRLFLTEYCLETQVFTIELQLKCNILEPEVGCYRMEKLICAKPANLVSHKATHFKRLT